MGEMREDLLRIIDDPTAGLDDSRSELRRLAVSLLAPDAARLPELLASDPSPHVRAAAAQALTDSRSVAALLAGGGDVAAEVREAVAFALGEIGDAAATEWLSAAAANDTDDGVREAAVAALGAIEDEGALALLVALSASAPPKVRRRAVVALSAFDHPAALEAIKEAASDRNPMVKEVAEMVVGPQREDLPWPSDPASGHKPQAAD